jgi:hypothetical protein
MVHEDSNVNEPNQRTGEPSTGAEREAPVASLPPAAPSGRRQAFRDLRRQLNDSDLTTPGVARLLLDEIEKQEAELEQLRGFVDRYHAANTRACVLDEKIKTVAAIEVFFGVGIGLGGAIIGVAPLFWSTQPRGAICFTVGTALIVGACVGRLLKR